MPNVLNIAGLLMLSVHLCPRFNSKDSATKAIIGVHATEVGGHTVKCSWGKESSDTQQQQQAAAGLQTSHNGQTQQVKQQCKHTKNYFSRLQ